MTLTRDSLLTLEAYAKIRKAEHARLVAYKRRRAVALGNHLRFLFEDETTIRYQIQEMLHIEKIFDDAGIDGELEAYLPLARLIGVEDRVYLRVNGHPDVYAIADEDLDRDNAEKTSAVHFVRFQLSGPVRAALKDGAALSIGCDHPAYSVPPQRIDADVSASLVADLR